jgi:cell division protein ZapA (FtsZ GTPase activity inhibitor)
MNHTDDMLELEIANRHLQLKCHPREVPLVKKIAEQIDQKITELQSSGHLPGHDRIILMALLPMIHALTVQQKSDAQFIEQLVQKINYLEQQITAVLPEE